jgi:fatty-acyl-CoA synthase
MPVSYDGPLPWLSDKTIGDVLRTTVSAYPDRDAVVFPALGVRWSWSELGRRVEQIARALIELGALAGEHVGIWSMNVPEWVVTQFAAARVGAVLVNVNPAYRIHELEDALRLADVSTLIVGCAFKGSDFVGMVHSVCPEVARSSASNWTCARLPRLKRLVALADRPGPGWFSWADLERQAGCSLADLEAREKALAAGDVQNIQFTSGTTGLPKGAMLTHRNLLMNAYYVGQRLRYTAFDRVCVPVPFYHCFGCVLGNLVCAVYGSAIVVPAPAFDPAATLAAIEQEQCTSLYGVPTMFVGELEQPGFSAARTTSLRTGIMAGAPCPLPLMEKVMNVMGIREICIGYGQTEASPIITFTEADDPIALRVGTVGRPLPGVEVKLVDPATGAETPADCAGELCARGHCVMAGYYSDPESTRRAIDSEGWLFTGDLARRGDSGTYRIVGRRKELIIRGGENIYPPEVEEFLHHHDDVAEVAVVGLPDAKYGEIVAAWIVPRAGAAPSPQEIKAYCQGQISYYKIPQHIFIVASLPKTVTGKVRKHVLKENAVSELGLFEAAAISTA